MDLCKHFGPRTVATFFSYISCLQAIYFVVFGPANIFFNILFTPLQENNGSSLMFKVEALTHQVVSLLPLSRRGGRGGG